MDRTLIISIGDIQRYRPVSEVDPRRVEPYIFEAQQNDLRPVLGDAFFNDLLKDFQTNATYVELLNGKEYEYNGEDIIFPGLKPVLVYYTLARYITSQPINMTSYGVVNKINQQSQPVDSRTLSFQATQFRDIAKSFENQMRQFLETNLSTYPLYKNGKGIYQPSGFKMFKG